MAKTSISGNTHKDKVNTHRAATSKPWKGKAMFIVQCQPRGTSNGATKITTATKKAALEAAGDFLNEGMPFVTIRLSGQVYTAEEFATTMAGVRKR